MLDNYSYNNLSLVGLLYYHGIIYTPPCIYLRFNETRDISRIAQLYILIGSSTRGDLLYVFTTATSVYIILGHWKIQNIT